MFKRKSSILITALAGVLTACGGKLLWESRFTEAGPKVVTAMAVDQLSNSYVGGSIRSADNLFEHNGLLIKHDPAGALLWQSSLEDGVAVIEVESVSADVIAVATGPYSSPLVNPEEASRELWLMSANTGEPLTLLHTFSPELDGQVLYDMKAIDGRLYVISGAEKEICAEVDGCITIIGQSVLRVYDANGNLTAEQTTLDQEIADFSVDVDHSLSVLLRKQNGNAEVQHWGDDLQPVWSGSAFPDSAAALAYCKPVAIKLHQQNALVLCRDSVVKLDSAGALVFKTSLDPLLDVTDYPMGTSGDYWYIEGLLALDDQGNVLIAKVRPTAYGTEESGTIGGIQIPTLSTLSSDTVTIKLSGQTGEILWNKAVSNAGAPHASGLKSYFHYPLNLTLRDDKVLVTMRSFGGVYNECNEWVDWDVFFTNLCSLISSESLLGRTVVYNAETGKRIASKQHDIPFPRKALFTPDGHVLVAGDMEPGYWNRFLEAVINGVAMFSESPDTTQFAETSDIILQKYKF